MRCARRELLCDIVGCGLRPATPDRAIRLVNDRDRRLLQRHVEADILLQLGHDRTPVRVTQNRKLNPALRLRHVPTCRYPEPSCRAAVKDGRRADLDTCSTPPGRSLTGASTAAGSRLNG